VKDLGVAIIGCGLGGATTAIALKDSGMDVRIYEQAPALGEVGAGVGLWPNALRALGVIGMADDVLALAGGPIGSGVRRPDGKWLLRQPREILEERWGCGLVTVHRAELHALLSAALDPSTLHLDARCTGIEQRDGSVQVRFADGAQVEADVLIGADGVHSVVRSWLSGPTPLRYRGYTNWRGITPPGTVPVVSEATDTWGRGARFGLQPTSGDRVLWYAGCNTPRGGVDDDQLTERLLEVFGGWHDPIASVLEATPHEAIIRNDIYDAWPSWKWNRGSVALIGDAIHPMTPDLGQGGCQAMVDGIRLAACLKEYSKVPEALRAYRRSRFSNAAMATLFSRIWGGVGQLDGRMVCAVRDTLVRALPLSMQLRQLDLVIGK
jgi:2-polyprenyl-6-methoxyphenol hydroxylase-like FAD-dependent oxidoreductase